VHGKTAGSVELFTRFADQVRGLVFSADISVREALENVRRSKQKIDLRQAGKAGALCEARQRWNTRDRIIVQALQLAMEGETNGCAHRIRWSVSAGLAREG